jgi:hypothetical protein
MLSTQPRQTREKNPRSANESDGTKSIRHLSKFATDERLVARSEKLNVGTPIGPAENPGATMPRI